MAADRLIGKQRVECRKPFGEGHLVIQQVQADMALAADRDAAVEFLTTVILPETIPAVQLPRDQVVKGQGRHSTAQLASTILRDLCSSVFHSLTIPRQCSERPHPFPMAPPSGA